MDYCLRLKNKRKSAWIDEAMELKINYTNALDIYNFLLQHKHQRVLIDFQNNEVYNEIEQKAIFSLKTEKHIDNFVLCLDFPRFSLTKEKEDDLMELIRKLIAAGIPFFFNDFVKDFSMLQYYISLGVSDVVVVEDMCFKLDKVSKVCKQHEVRVRVFPNICQSSTPHGDICDFFIRPEDIQFYEEYVNVCEFSCLEDRQDTYYKIYVKDKKWFGNLQEIIIGLEKTLDSRFIVRQFAETRVHCGKRCFEGSSCFICQRCLELAATLQENDIIVEHY